MEDFVAKQKELETLTESKANEIVKNLIHLNAGKSAYDLRSATLSFIREHQIHEVIASRVKHEIEHFISNIKIPAQEK